MNELVTHKREVADVNRLMRKFNAAEKFDEVGRLCEIVQSHMACAKEAAWREDREFLKTHLGHAREALILALKVTKEGFDP